MKPFGFFLFFLLGLSSQGISQTLPEQTIKKSDTTLYKVVTNDKNELIGFILKEDSREILFKTTEGREIIIPQYAIKKIEEVKSTDFNAKGQFIGEDKFSTRYFITTNGLPLKKGENYMQWNWFGPDVQFAVTDHLGLGLMTSWLATPIIGTAKYSFNIGKNVQACVGGLVGTSSWLALPSMDLNLGFALPFASLSFGNRTHNLAVSGGYGAGWYDLDVEGRYLLSVAGMTKIGRKVSLVFDSFIMPGTSTTYNPTFALLIPGIRVHLSEGNAFQFGLTGVIANYDVLPVPIPMMQWYRSF